MDIKKSSAGKVVKTLKGYFAFVPNNLPPKFDWNTDLVNSLSNADHVLGKLSLEGTKLKNPYVFVRPFMVREAVLSSKIEGTRSTISEILADQAGILTKSDQDDLQEVKNYIDALDYGLKRLETLPLSLMLIQEIHKILMSGVRGQHATPGEFRRTQNWIGIPGSTLMTAKFVPPAPEHLMDALSAFEIFLHNRRLPPLIHAALCHYQFEAIHPFLDGNGRIGRLLIILLLVEQKIISRPILYLSAFFESTRDEYYRQLFNVSSQGTWYEWFIYFLNGVATQSVDALLRIEKIGNIIKQWHEKIGNEDGIIHEIIDHLAVNPFLTIKNVSEYFNIAFTTASRAIENLEKHRIIVETTEQKRGRIYVAKSILEILEEKTDLKNY